MPNLKIIGYIKGRPIYEIRGASEPVVEAPAQPEAKPEAVLTQSQVNALLAEQKRKAAEKYGDYGDLKAKADKLDAIEEKNKTDLQREQERAAAAEQRATEAETKALRAEVALDKGIPANLLAGTTKEELEASAAALLAFRGAQPPTKQPIPGFTPGAETSKKAGREAGLAEAERRFGSKKI